MLDVITKTYRTYLVLTWCTLHKIVRGSLTVAAPGLGMDTQEPEREYYVFVLSGNSLLFWRGYGGIP